MGPLVFYADQAECVMRLKFNCERVTVHNLVECVQAQVASGGCDRPEEHCHWLYCR